MTLISKLKEQINRNFPELARLYRYNISQRVPQHREMQKKLLNHIREKETVNVIFFISTLGMWRYQSLYDILSKDNHFNCYIVISPLKNYSREEKEKSIRGIINYLNNLNVPFIDAYHNYDQSVGWLKDLKPDMLFYSQPYDNLFGNCLDERYYRHKLLCYCPYGVSTISNAGLYNTPLQNIAWKLFYPTKFNLNDARNLADNHGKNVIVTGDLNMDLIRTTAFNDPWKPQTKIKKKIIWAPHFTVKPSFCLSRASFIWLHDIMLEIARRYEDSIQIAFKPHPRLKSELYNLDGWGKEQTDRYYESWVSGNNTQLEEGAYYDLFSTSDAMIHDCGSFSVEYLYTRKPVMFTSSDAEHDIAGLNTLGQASIRHHYIGSKKEDIISFIENLIKGNDPMKIMREEFYTQNLKSPDGKSVAENIYRIFLNEFKFC